MAITIIVTQNANMLILLYLYRHTMYIIILKHCPLKSNYQINFFNKTSYSTRLDSVDSLAAEEELDKNLLFQEGKVSVPKRHNTDRLTDR